MKKKGQQHTFDAAWQPLPAWQCINGYSYEVGVRNALTSSPHRGDFFSCLINAPKKLLSLEKHAKLLVESPVALNSNSAVESAQRSDHPWQARQQGGGWTINQYRPSRSVHPPWRPASPPGVTNPFLSPRSVPKVRVSAERRCATEPPALLGVLLHLLVSRTLFYHPGRCRKSALARNEGAPPSLRQGPRCHQRAWSWF